MTDRIRAEDVREAVEDLVSTPEGDYRESRASRKLDRFANSYRFGGSHIECDDGAERDEIVDMLGGHGSQSFAQWMYGD